jgi:hypothetical protein
MCVLDSRFRGNDDAFISMLRQECNATLESRLATYNSILRILDNSAVGLQCPGDLGAGMKCSAGEDDSLYMTAEAAHAGIVASL